MQIPVLGSETIRAGNSLESPDHDIPIRRQLELFCRHCSNEEKLVAVALG